MAAYASSQTRRQGVPSHLGLRSTIHRSRSAKAVGGVQIGRRSRLAIGETHRFTDCRWLL